MKCVKGIEACQGPYAPSGVTCCHFCSIHHEQHPDPNCLCDNCKEKYGKLGELGLSPTLFVVNISEEFIYKVASKAEVSPDRVKDYLNNQNEQNNNIFKAFAYYQVFPLNKKYVKE